MDSKNRICNVNCCVYGCHSRKNREARLSFHRFPKAKSGFVYITNKLGIMEKVDRLKAWELKLLMGNRRTSCLRVCSLHFNEDDFILPGIRTKLPRLKTTAVPSQNLPVRSFTKFKPKRRQLLKHVSNSASSMSTNIDDISEAPRIVSALEQIAITSLLDLVNTQNVPSSSTITNEQLISTADKSVQVKSGDIIIPFIACIDSNSKLSTLTGLTSFDQLNVLIASVTEAFPELRRRKMSVKERIIMTFMKLKTGLRYVALASLFATVTSKTCKLICYDTISKLCLILKHLIIWPSSEECRSNLPTCFEKFSNVRAVFDCTEFPVQRSKRLCCRILTYSHYKGMQTIKFLTGVSPAGLITFISQPYGGRASDKTIFEQSNLISKLDSGKDAIMVDKGFRIDDLTNLHKIKLIRPAFLRKKSQFSEEESKLNVDISKARVHIERANQRIKSFEILAKPLPITLVPKIEEIFTIICAVVNISNPILGDDKFMT